MNRIEELRKMLAADQDDPDIPYMLAQEYAKASEHDSAIEFYDRCIGLKPTYAYAYYHKARSQQSSGKLDDARATLRVGLEQARAAGDRQAVNEITAYIDELEED